MDARVREGVDVLLTNPRLVATGLDLVAFAEVVFVETDYSTYTLRQAARRSWRIGQREPVTVTHLVYDQTMQAEALALVAAKLRASLAVEGELPEDGLAALEADGADVVLALARRLAQPAAAAEARSLEALFAEARQQEAADDALLVADGWHAMPADAADAPLPFDSGGSGMPAFNGASQLADLPLFAVASVSATGAELATSGAAGRVVRLEDLTRLVTRPKTRSRRPTPTDQLGLFGG